MKIPILPLLFALCCGSMAAHAQDAIIPKSGEQIRAKVLKVNESDIEYKLFDYQDGPMHTLLKSDVAVIVYQNGTRDSFSIAQSGYDGSLSMADKGKADARQYYNGYRPAMTGAIVSGVLMGSGIIPGVIIYCTPPAYESLHFPSSALMDNYAYRDGYVRAAGQIKRRKTLAGYGIGMGITTTVVLAFVAAFTGR